MNADTIETRLRVTLAAVAATQTPTGDWDDVLGRARPEPENAPRRWPLLVAATLVATAVVSYAALVSDAPPRRVDVVAADPTSTPTTTASTTTVVTIEPMSSLRFGVPWATLPDWGVVVRDPDGEGRVLGPDGSLIATVNAAEFAPTPLQSVVAVPDGGEGAIVLPRDVTAGPAPADCVQPVGYWLSTRSDGPDATYSVCGADVREIWVTRDGETSVLTGAPSIPSQPGPLAGHWRNAVPSPDGTWLLAQWSGECEAPAAFIVPTDGGVARQVVSSDDGGGGPLRETIHLGWTPDGRAIVQVLQPLCGDDGVDQTPGVFLVDPNGRDAVETVTWLPENSPGTQVWTWRKADS